MQLSPSAVYDILTSKGVERLHHANSVLTAAAFLQAGRLLSRGNIERGGKLQSSQYTDAIDKKYSIWFDVFTDSVDIHTRARSLNKYGPVLFEIDIDILKSGDTGKVWVTKLNPTKWSGKGRDERWFSSKSDLEDNFSYGTFDQMILFRHCGGELDIRKFLKRIVLDDPKVTWDDGKATGIDSFSMAYGVLTHALSVGKIKVPIERRVCSTNCTCKSQYNKDSSFTQKMFFPEPA